MNPTFAACALIMSGWVSQDAEELVAPSPDNLQQTAYKAPNDQPASHPAQPAAKPITHVAGNHAVRASVNGNLPRPRMPLSPTDPRVMADSNLPSPPTMDSAGPMPNMKTVDTRPHYVAVGPGEEPNRHALNERPFEHHHNPSPVSPYMLLYNNTANGTVSTYNAYVRPALAQRKSQFEEEMQAGEGTPSYPSVFLNHGQYYPVEPER
jgi:hypothetical protein